MPLTAVGRVPWARSSAARVGSAARRAWIARSQVRKEGKGSEASEVKRTSRWRFGREVGIVKVLREAGSRPRVRMMSVRTWGVAVAVRHMMGTSGNAWRNQISSA